MEGAVNGAITLLVLLGLLVGAWMFAKWIGRRTGRRQERDRAELAANREGQRFNKEKLEGILLRQEARKLDDLQERVQYEALAMDDRKDISHMSQQAQGLIIAARERRKNQ